MSDEQKKKKPSESEPVQGSEMSQLFNAMAEGMRAQAANAPARQQMQNDVMFGRHLGTGGAPITPENPTGNLGNPFGAEGLFHGGFRSQMSPEAIAKSQGGTAVNQWNDPMHFHGSAPSEVSNADAARAASGQTNPVVPRAFPTPTEGPGGMKTPPALGSQFDFYRHPNAPLGAPQTGASFGFPTPAPNAPKPPTPPPSGPLGSPQPGFRFGM